MSCKVLNTCRNNYVFESIIGNMSTWKPAWNCDITSWSPLCRFWLSIISLRKMVAPLSSGSLASLLYNRQKWQWVIHLYLYMYCFIFIFCLHNIVFGENLKLKAVFCCLSIQVWHLRFPKTGSRAGVGN